MSINPTQISEAFVKVVKEGATLRTQALQEFSQSIVEEQSALRVELSRVVSLYGENSHQAILVNERLLQNSSLGQSVTAELRRAQVRVPAPSHGEFIVYGRVLESTGQPLRDVEVSATEPSGSVLVKNISDTSGRFELHVAVSGPELTTFQLAVSDKNSAALLRVPEVMTPAAGMLAYRDLTMPA